jgi:hypothetical protein
MRYLCLFIALACFGQTSDKPKADPLTRDPKEKARQLLDGVSTTVSSAQPEVQVIALRMLADNYSVFDKKKSAGYFEQAFAAAGALPETIKVNRIAIQGDVVTAAAGVDATLAVRLLRQMPPGSAEYDPRMYTTQKVIEKLLDQKRFDEAIGLLEWCGTDGQYPFFGASQIFQRLPQEDPRRMVVLQAAAMANSRTPDRAFVHMLLRFKEELPVQMLQESIREVLREILSRKGQDGNYETYSMANETGTVSFQDPKDRDLFEIMWVVREIDSRRYEDILASRPALKAALDRYPQGTRSMSTGPMWMFTTRGNDKASVEKGGAAMQSRAIAQTRALAALKALREDPQKALDMVSSIPDPARQAEVLAAVARTVSEADPGRAKAVLNKCIALLKDIQDPGDRAATWDAIADGAHLIKDDEMAQDILEKALADAQKMQKLEEAGISPDNRVPRENWPSTQSYLRVIHRATKMLGVDAEPILNRITDPDLQILARVEMAQALLGRQHGNWRTIRPMPKKRS